jgi:SnoaL-like domain
VCLSSRGSSVSCPASGAYDLGMAPELVVRLFHERMQARDWRAAEALLADDVHIEYPTTGEAFDGPSFLAMNEAYPEGWEIDVVEAIGVGDRVAARVLVTHGDLRHWCAGFYSVVDDKISTGTEHWITENSETPPDWRSDFSS